MRKTLLRGALVIAGFGVAAAGVIWWTTEPRGPDPQAAPRPRPEAPWTPPAATTPATEGAAPPASPGPGRPAPPSGRPEPGGGPADLLAGQAPLGERVSACAASGPRGGPGRPPGMAMVVLRLEGLEGRVRITGVDGQRRGGASGEVLACARAEMVGREIPVAVSVPGRSWSMPYAIRP